MNRFFTLLLAATCLTAVGQVTYPYNPDGNADGDIAVGDLQDFLVTYGNPFSPSEIMVGDSSLTYWVEQLSQTIQEQQMQIDSMQLVSSFAGFGPRETVDAVKDISNWSFQPSFNYGLIELQFEEDGLLTLSDFAINVHVLPANASVTFFSDSFEEYFVDIHFFDSSGPLRTIFVKSNEVVWLKLPLSSWVWDAFDNIDVSFVPVLSSTSLADGDSDFETTQIPNYSIECIDMGYSPLCGALGFSQWATLEPNSGYRYNMGWSGPNVNDAYLIDDPHWRKFQIIGLPDGIDEVTIEYTENGNLYFTDVDLDFDAEGNAFIYLYASCNTANSECSGLAISLGAYDFPLSSALGVKQCYTGTKRHLKLHYSDGWSLVAMGVTIDVN